MTFISQCRRYHRRELGKSEGQVAGLYLKPARRSQIQFEPIFLGNGMQDESVLVCLNRALDKLYADNQKTQVDWYIERSLGLDVDGRIAWCNLDITDCIVP